MIDTNLYLIKTWRKGDSFNWWSMLLTDLTSLGDKRASHPPRQFHNLLRLHSFQDSFWCFHWVASVEIRYHPSTFSWCFPGEIDSGSIVQCPIGMCTSDCLSDSLIHGACCCFPVWNVIGINSGTGWYHIHFYPNSSWEELRGGDWWCSLGVERLSLSCLIQHLEKCFCPNQLAFYTCKILWLLFKKCNAAAPYRNSSTIPI